MSSDLKPITLHGHSRSPNPFKVAIILEELGIPYEKASSSRPLLYRADVPHFILGKILEDSKVDWHVKLNPNGRVPTIVDHNNNDFVLWESGAIVEYLVETYDKDNRLSFADGDNKWLLKQFLHFQMSGQGPYWGQAVWFDVLHPEDVPSAKTRYQNEIVRVIGVLDGILKDKEWLVGGKMTYADIAFYPWIKVISNEQILGNIIKRLELREKYPNFFAWHDRVHALDSVKRAYGDMY
ncbi:Glutathione S-transferase-like protein [Hapsidospora chrysogenum ATCC 11550]|uniref:Glutathione S-transferase-like protein n=1 Tax=Hapsidospora chrysogenum (strain ATCC 11550 / CBS 779.69 / DSM 880 / IAM 14645 / JCM 23072 / IMI 49137) TaxID=857340 RepID=A0A086T3V8_HAPC1|nr:Glutathione S-transferase-like protein [Hapsidospora chrysogenum ATCC 11550]